SQVAPQQSLFPLQPTYKDMLFRSKNHPTILQLGNKWSVSSYHFTISLVSWHFMAYTQKQKPCK
ncbi:hypothetical protein, partial [uncultured Duncaniella sp.]|uniref:hypothetical protein n=1 Tax=uncultured Duncaniella sp. TaxID=2768039 RepID=UPI0026039AE1